MLNFEPFEPLGESIIETMKKQLPKKTGKKVEFRMYYEGFIPIGEGDLEPLDLTQAIPILLGAKEDDDDQIQGAEDSSR